MPQLLPRAAEQRVWCTSSRPVQPPTVALVKGPRGWVWAGRMRPAPGEDRGGRPAVVCRPGPGQRIQVGPRPGVRGRPPPGGTAAGTCSCAAGVCWVPPSLRAGLCLSSGALSDRPPSRGAVRAIPARSVWPHRASRVLAGAARPPVFSASRLRPAPTPSARPRGGAALCRPGVPVLCHRPRVSRAFRVPFPARLMPQETGRRGALFLPCSGVRWRGLKHDRKGAV